MLATLLDADRDGDRDLVLTGRCGGDPIARDQVQETHMKQRNRRSVLFMAAWAIGCGNDPVGPGSVGSNQVPDALLPLTEEVLGALQGASRDGQQAGKLARASRSSVKGQVERDFGHALERYSFNAHYRGNGTVGGRFHLRDMFADGTEDITVHGRITCFTIEADGKTARLGGVIETASQDQFVGTFAAWTVRDNGNSRKEPRDQATDLSFGATNASFAASHCRVGIPLEGFGTFGESPRNLKVKP